MELKNDETWQRLQGLYGEKSRPQREVKKHLDQGDFMKIMIAQMKNQDPTKPFEAEKLAQEIAQIATVEQMSGVNTMLKTLSTQNRPLERMAMTNLIGKEVVVDKNRFVHSKDQVERLTFNLPSAAKKVSVSIISETGEQILEKNLGELPEGTNTFSWDGLKGNLTASESGNYLFRVTAETGDGKMIPLDTQSRERILGVSYQGTEPVFMIGDPKTPTKIPFNNIVEIAEAQHDSKTTLSQQAKEVQTTQTAQSVPPTSQQETARDLPPEIAERVRVAEAKIEAEKKKNMFGSEGFPNGMNVYNVKDQEGGE